METVKPGFVVIYEKRDITADISRRITSLKYVDRLEGESDEVTLTFENSDLIWLNNWFPNKGDKISVMIGVDGDYLPCGEFTIDSFNANGNKISGDTFKLKALAAGINSPLRTKKSRAHDGQTLRQIAERAAKDNGLELVDGTQKTVKVNINVDIEHDGLIAGADALDFMVANIDPDEWYNITIALFPRLIAIANNLKKKGYPELSKTITQELAFLRTNVTLEALFNVNGVRAYIKTSAKKMRTIAGTLKNRSYSVTTSQLDNIRINRITQNNETDLQFLMRIGRLYGFVFSVRGAQLIFVALVDVLNLEGVGTYTNADITDYGFNDKATQVYKNAVVKSHNPVTGKTIAYDTAANGNKAVTGPAAGVAKMVNERAENANYKPTDTLVINHTVDNDQQAELVAYAGLNLANSKTRSASFTLPGNIYLCAGNSFFITGFGAYNGKWHIKESSHDITKTGGYKTTVDVDGH